LKIHKKEEEKMFEKIKQKWAERIQRNAVKSNLTYIKPKGIKLMKEKGYTEEQVPEKYKVTETVFFKRSLLPLGDWNRIYPPISEDGKKLKVFNFIFGGWRNFIKLIVILVIIGLIISQYYQNIEYIISLKDQLQYCNIKIPLK
jgi:hypothetical protein